MFSPPIFWRINNLVSTLSKKNNKSHLLELAELTKMFGEDSRAFLLASLLDEIDFKDQRTNGNRDAQKIALLQEEVSRGVKTPNFSGLFLQAMEGGNRRQSLQQGAKLPEDFLGTICRTLKLSPVQTMAVAYAISRSQYRSLAQDAVKLLRSRLPEIGASSPLGELSEDILHGLALLASSSEDLTPIEISGNFLAAMRSMPQKSPIFAPLGGAGAMKDADLQAMAAATRNRMSIASIMSELGIQVSANADSFRKFLREVNIPLNEEQVAMIIIAILPKTGDDQKEAQQWNLEVIADVLSQECRVGLNWTTVAQRLDQPNLILKSEIDFQMLARLFSRISGGPIPAAGLVGLWSNRPAQLAILMLSTKAPRNVVDFAGLVTADQRIPGEVPVPQNFSWMALPLYATLIDLAASGYQMEVLEGLTAAASVYPEYIAVSLAQVQDPTSGVRAEVLRRTLPLFTGIAGSRPTSMAVMVKLQAVNPDLLVLLCRIAFKRARTLQEIVETDARLKNLGGNIARRVEEEGTVDELLSYWCVRADRSDFNLEEKIASVLERNPQTARALAVFAQGNLETLRPRAADGGVLSIESFTVLLRGMQAFPAIVSVDEVRMLASALNQQQVGGQVHQAAGGINIGVGPEGIDPAAEGRPTGPDAAEVDEEANAYFQKIYTSDITIPEVIQLLKQFKTSTNVREQEIFRCMIHNLFDEYRFFHKYPDKELQVTGRLFGTLIQHQLVSSITLGIALRYVLEALRKDPEQGGSSEKMFRFGKISLEHFRARLGEWPQYCSHLVQIPHLARHCPELFQDAQRAINNPLPPSGPGEQTVDPTAGLGGPIPSIPGQSRDPMAAMSQQMSGLQIGNTDGDDFRRNAGMVTNSVLNAAAEDTRAADIQALSAIPANAAEAAAESVSQAALPSDLDVDIKEESASTRLSIIERMAEVNVDVMSTSLPPENLRDQIHFIINNIAKNNCEQKSNELRGMLQAEHYNWFANYLVVKRISTQANLHPLYLAVLDTIDSAVLGKIVLNSVYHNVTKLLQSPNITTSTSERSLLRNLGIWLGQMTLARNKPLLQRRINMKELLFWGYETGRLIAVCSFVARIVEGVRDSKVFRPPNPWLMALLGVLRELYEIEDLKMNIKFEVQVLCKNINIKIEDIPRTNQLSRCRMPVKDSRNPDFNLKNVAAAAAAAAAAGSSASPMVPSSPAFAGAAASSMPSLQGLPSIPLSVQQSGPFGSMLGLDQDAASKPPADVGPAGMQEQTVIPNLSSYITINPSIQFFVANPAQRRLVSLAVDRAIREIIQPVVERSVIIASVSTKQLILKDFATESNEQTMRNAAHLMISNLAGSLAVTTCKEPLRLSIANHLRSMLLQVTNDQAMVEQIVQVCANDNLELGCMLIEKASTEKALRDVDESLAAAMQARRKARETGQPFVDQTVNKPGAKYPRELPDALKPRPGGLHPQQLQVYEAFQRQRTPAAQPGTVGSSPMTGVGAQGPQMVGGQALPPAAPQGAPTLSMSQALEAYQLIYARIDMALKTVQMQAQGRDISLSMLGGDHEILSHLRDLIVVTQRTQATIRSETAMTFCENVFKRMVESVAVPDALRLEVMVGILEALRDACGGPKKFSPDIVSWLSHYAAFNANDETSRKMHRVVLVLLLRAKLLRSQDVDIYFATYMDGGRNMVWVELSLAFVRQCLAEGLAATYEFANTFETVSKIRPSNAAVKKQLQKWLTDLRALAASKEEQKQVVQQQVTGANVGTIGPSPAAPAAATAGRDNAVRETVTALLERWLRVWNTATDAIFAQYIQLMHQYGVLKTEEAADKFFRVATDLCIEACINGAQPTPGAAPQGPDGIVTTTLTYTVIDALAKLFILLVRLADKEAADPNVRVNLLSRIINAIARSLIEDHEAKKNGKAAFDQRPYFRLFSSLMQDHGVPDPKQDSNPAVAPLLGAFHQVLMAIQPSTCPGFAFAWLQLISHRCFMPQLLLIRGQKGWPYMHRLIIAMLLFLQPFLKHAQLNESIRRLYKGTLRVLLVLLHDFPEFLCDYHLSFCDVIPSTCVQLRNLILSAFPRTMRLPDPFTPQLKVDLLPEISQAPRILTDFIATLNDRGIKQRVDTYMASKQPAELPSLLPSALVLPGGAAANGGSPYNVPLINALVVYVASLGVVQLQNKMPLQGSPAMDIFKQLIAAFDSEGRYHVINAMANQLRYPNSHTHYFSCVVLTIFADAENEAVQELITRVLLERLIVHRPHPWGLLITFIELIKNPRFNFWRRGFTHCAPELERVFESVARSCMGPAAAAAMLQQAQAQQSQGIVAPGSAAAPGQIGDVKPGSQR